MKRLLEFLLTGCFHEWEIYKTNPVYDSYDGQLTEYPIGEKITLRCKKCGEMKTFKTY